MTSARAVLAVVAVVAVLLCAQVAQAQPDPPASATTLVNLTVDKYVDISIPQGPEEFPGFPGVWMYPMRQSTMFGAGPDSVTPNVIAGGNTVKMYANLDIHASANTPVWVRVPDHLYLEDHGTYRSLANVTVTQQTTPTSGDLVDSYYYLKYSSVSPGAKILTCEVSRTQQWTAADLAGIYWASLFVDIVASDSETAPTTWPTHVEPNYPPHTPPPPLPGG